MRDLANPVCALIVTVTGLSGLWHAGQALAQNDSWHMGVGGASWDSEADVQIGAASVGGALQPVQIPSGVNLTQLLAQLGQQWQNGPPEEFTVGGLPHTWSNSTYFNQIRGPLLLVDGDGETSSGDVFKSSGNPAGTALFLDLGTSYPVNRVRFYPPADEPDSYVRAFQLTTSSGDDFDGSRRPNYRLLRRVDNNGDVVVDFEFQTSVVRFLQVKNLSRTPFVLAEVEVYGEGFVSASSYLSKLHRFAVPSSFGTVTVAATRLGNGPDPGDDPPRCTVRLRTGSDDTPVSYYRRDRQTGEETEVSQNEYERLLPRLAYYRVDPVTGAQTEAESRADYLALPVDEQGPVLDFVQGAIRSDSEHWSPWSVPIELDTTGSVSVDLGLEGPREYAQLAAEFAGDSRNAMRLDAFGVEFAPLLATAAVGEIALAATPAPSDGVCVVDAGTDETFTCDIRATFTQAGLSGFAAIRIESFPPPVFERLEMGDPLAPVAAVGVQPRERGFDVRLPLVDLASNQPIRVIYRQSILEHSTSAGVWLLGPEGGVPQPVAAGNARDQVTTNSLLVYTVDPKPAVAVDVSPPLVTPNGDGVHDALRIGYRLIQFSGEVDVRVEVLDLAGRLVRRLADDRLASGDFGVVWDGRSGEGAVVAPGNYICRVEVQAQARTFTTARVVGVAY